MVYYPVLPITELLLNNIKIDDREAMAFGPVAK
jgi:hypothetical protein